MSFEQTAVPAQNASDALATSAKVISFSSTCQQTNEDAETLQSEVASSCDVWLLQDQVGFDARTGIPRSRASVRMESRVMPGRIVPNLGVTSTPSITAKKFAAATYERG